MCLHSQLRVPGEKKHCCVYQGHSGTCIATSSRGNMNNCCESLLACLKMHDASLIINCPGNMALWQWIRNNWYEVDGCLTFQFNCYCCIYPNTVVYYFHALLLLQCIHTCVKCHTFWEWRMCPVAMNFQDNVVDINDSLVSVVCATFTVEKWETSVQVRLTKTPSTEMSSFWPFGRVNWYLTWPDKNKCYHSFL